MWLLAWIVVSMTPAKAGNPQNGFPQKWTAKTVVTEKEVQQAGLDRCFASEPINDETFQRMQGKSWKKDCPLKRSELRYLRLLHRNAEGKPQLGEMVVNAQIADRVVRILRQLYDAKYPIQRMVLPDVYDADDETQMRANNSSCFCYRPISGTTKLSKHARGLAIDINTLYNPYYKDRTDGTRYIQPATAAEYCDRTKTFPYKIDHDDLCFRLFTEAGFEWGGDWTSCKDFQHFELIE